MEFLIWLGTGTGTSTGTNTNTSTAGQPSRALQNPKTALGGPQFSVGFLPALCVVSRRAISAGWPAGFVSSLCSGTSSLPGIPSQTEKPNTHAIETSKIVIHEWPAPAKRKARTSVL